MTAGARSGSARSPEAAPRSPPPSDSRQRIRRLLSLVQEVTLGATGNEPLEAKLERCVQILSDALQLSFCGVWRIDPRTGSLAEDDLVAHVGTPASPEGDSPLPDLRWAWEGAEPEADRARGIASGPGEERASEHRAGAHALGRVIPLGARGRRLGVLVAHPQHLLTDAEEAVLVTVSGPLALLLDAARVERERESFRDVFVWMLGHDLRNPLNAISIGAHILGLAEGLPEATAQVARNMQRSTRRIGRMVSQLLDFVQDRATGEGRFPIHVQEADVRQACATALLEQRERFPRAEVIEAYAGDTSGCFDLERLTQVMATLLANAIAHGDPEKPVELSVVRQEDHVLIQVHNAGPGISLERRAALLDPFLRPGRAKGPGSEGLGLGLYVARRLVQAHGGELYLASSDEGGTTFSIRLPAGPPGA